MSKGYLIFISHTLIFLAGFYAGFHCASKTCEIEKLEFQNKIAVQNEEAINKKNATENVYRDAVSRTQSNLFNDLKDVEKHFISISANGFNDHRDGMQSNSATDSSSAMPSGSKASTGIQKLPCRCSETYRKQLQRVYAEQLIIARDCDIRTTYYNKILELYNSISNE